MPDALAGEVEGPSYVPGKDVAEFRVYRTDAAADSWDARVYQHYSDMRQHQTLAFVERMLAKYAPMGHASMTIREAFDALLDYVDASDPDSTMPNIVHAFQTAERARVSGEPEWLQFVALIHDLGKIMFLWSSADDGQGGKASDAQWSLGGDTWVAGCRIPDCTVYPELNALNPDMAHPVYATELGVYDRACGIMNLKFAFGHDEYMYLFARANKLAIPEEGYAMLRLHSCYPWHQGGAYRQFMTTEDDKLLAAVLHFNQYDLYSKSDTKPDIAALWPYYQALIDKFAPGKLNW